MAALSITAANVTLNSGNVENADAATGVTVTAGQTCTLDSSNNVVLAANTSTALAGTNGLFIALANASPGQPVPLAQKGASIDLGVSSIDGLPYFIGAAGEIVPFGDLTTGDVLSFLGYGTTSDNFVLSPVVTGRTIP